MPGARLPMRKIRDMLRLTAAGMSSRKIAASLSIGGTTVVDCLRRARAVGLAGRCPRTCPTWRWRHGCSRPRWRWPRSSLGAHRPTGRRSIAS